MRRLERTWLDAYEARDAGAMANILDQRFSITFEDGDIRTRRQVLDQLSRGRRETAPRFATSCVASGAYGGTVVMVGVVTTASPAGKSRRSRYTDTYVRTPGGWRVAASHLSRLESKDTACPKLGF